MTVTPTTTKTSSMSINTRVQEKQYQILLLPAVNENTEDLVTSYGVRNERLSCVVRKGVYYNKREAEQEVLFNNSDKT